MSTPQYYKTVWMEDGTGYVTARITRKNSSHAMVIPATSDFTSITRGAYSVPSSSVISAATTLTTTDVVLTALSTANIWTVDSTGFNFIDTVPSTYFANANQQVRVEYLFTLTSGEKFALQVDGPVHPAEGS